MDPFLEVSKVRSTVLATFVLIVVASLAVAQQAARPQPPAASNPGPKAGAQTSPAESSIEGCLGGGAGNYTVTDKAGTSYKLQFPQNADSSVLDKHIGQEVRVSGAISGASGGASATASDSGAAGVSPGRASAGQPTITPTTMQAVAEKCVSKMPPSGTK